MAPPIRRIALAVGLVLAPWPGVGLALHLLGAGARPRVDQRWEAIVVAGCALDEQGRPSEALKRRVALGVALWRQGLAPLVVFTGGAAGAGPSEAEGAAIYARELGLPEQAVRREERATSTRENAAFTAELWPFRRVVLVTDSYHVPRATRVFARYFDEVEPAAAMPPLASALRGSLREVVALGWYWVRGWL